MSRSAHDVRRFKSFATEAISDYELARRTGIPRSTVQRWRRVGTPGGGSRGRPSPFPVDELPGGPYAYLLGQYLGDGTIYGTGPGGGGRTLRISSDAAYPGIIRECSIAVGQIRGRPPACRTHPTERMVDIVSTWKEWPRVFPQHGPGRKHSRTIALAVWQTRIVEAYPGPFLRGLIHSDGWRGVNKVHVKGRTYRYPRYQFSNRPDDIRQLFVYACELVGVAWRPWGRYHVSVARREAVALLDEFVGPKR